LQGFITDPYVIILSCILFLRVHHILQVVLSAFTSCPLSLVATVLLDSVCLFPDIRINIVSTLPWPGPMYDCSPSKCRVQFMLLTSFRGTHARQRLCAPCRRVKLFTVKGF